MKKKKMHQDVQDLLQCQLSQVEADLSSNIVEFLLNQSQWPNTRAGHALAWAIHSPRIQAHF
jgi:hypothetical protein